MSDLLNFYINDDCVVKESIIDPKRNIGQEEIVMDKKTFKECYKKWVLEDKENISFSSEKSKDDIEEIKECYKCSKEYEQLAEWLKELKQLRESTGYWIFVDEAHEHARCSKCDYGDVDLMDGKLHNYCQNCGAKMYI